MESRAAEWLGGYFWVARVGDSDAVWCGRTIGPWLR
jgi:hypothetical protein